MYPVRSAIGTLTTTRGEIASFGWSAQSCILGPSCVVADRPVTRPCCSPTCTYSLEWTMTIHLPSQLRPTSFLFFIVLSLCHLQRYAHPAAVLGAGERVDLTRSRAEDELHHVRVQFEVDGDLRLRGAVGEQAVTTPVRVRAQLAYDEKTLERDPSRPVISHAVRHYHTAAASIGFREGRVEPVLRDDRQLIAVAARSAEQVVLFSPFGPLTRDELDLITVPGNSLLIDILLPQRTVGVGEKWKVESDLLPALVGLDAVGEAHWECTLERIERERAIVHATGAITGTAGGVLSEMTLAAKFSFDRRHGRITWFAMTLKENRAIGHAHPGLEATARVQMTIEPKKSSTNLSAALLAQLDLNPSVSAQLIEFDSPSGGFQLLLDRSWHVLIERPDVSVLRMVDRGDLIAQCNISALAPLDDGVKFTLVDFQQDIRRALDTRLGEFVTASESINDHELHVMRVVVHGRVSDLPIEWVYYHLSYNRGRRASCVCTYELSLSERFGGADHSLVSSFRFLDLDASRPAADRATDSARRSPERESTQRR
jgi:hypothetical protein